MYERAQSLMKNYISSIKPSGAITGFIIFLGQALIRRRHQFQDESWLSARKNFREGGAKSNRSSFLKQYAIVSIVLSIASFENFMGAKVVLEGGGGVAESQEEV